MSLHYMDRAAIFPRQRTGTQTAIHVPSMRQPSCRRCSSIRFSCFGLRGQSMLRKVAINARMSRRGCSRFPARHAETIARRAGAVSASVNSITVRSKSSRRSKSGPPSLNASSRLPPAACIDSPCTSHATSSRGKLLAGRIASRASRRAAVIAINCGFR